MRRVVPHLGALVRPRPAHFSAISDGLHGHELGHAPVANQSWSGMHATTILAVRKGGRVVRFSMNAASPSIQSALLI